MGSRSWSKRVAIGFAILIPLLLLASLFMPAPAQADGGFALSGSFYRQPFEIPQGSSVSGPSIYVVVFNNRDEDIRVRMTTEAPAGVNINVSPDDFAIQAGGQQQVLIGVEVTEDAVPGEYEIRVTAEPYKEAVGGIQILGTAGQTASLAVVGESAWCTVQAVNPAGEPMVAVVRLFKVIAGQNYEFAYSDTGTLEAMVSPGSFIAEAYVGGEKLAEESFDVAAGEEKTVTLTVGTVYFEGFGVVPCFDAETGQLAFAQIVYAVRNLYQPVANAEVMLLVTRDGAPLAEISLATLSPLDIGRVGLSYNYIPPEGWLDGIYGFRLQLILDGEPYITTVEEQLEVMGGSVAGEGQGGISAALIGGIVAAVLAAAGVAYFLVRTRRAKRRA